MDEDRRKHPRYKVDVSARLSWDGQSLEADVNEICRDAVLVEADRAFEVGASVRLTADLPDGSVDVPARVIRIVPAANGRHQMALLFADVTPAAATQIELFLDGFSEDREP